MNAVEEVLWYGRSFFSDEADGQVDNILSRQTFTARNGKDRPFVPHWARHGLRIGLKPISLGFFRNIIQGKQPLGSYGKAT